MASYKQTEYEVLRRRCVALHQQGWKQVAIAQALGLTQGWVSRTLTKYQQQGQAALAWRKPAGATARLSQTQLAQLVEELNKGAEHHGFPGQLWTRPRVNEVIKKLFGVSYDPSQVGRLLKKVEWTRQKPQPKARQQNPERIKQWREERLPELKKSSD
ncbi:winged helix-turn-helix domain-containing protein [Larkinella bovis]|uniref:Winged helix-turn-helix domain-containing protein n=1 Tax=Larkinella bovis TaxID=683041 RepID=A0ABW0IEC3_9BACT